MEFNEKTFDRTVIYNGKIIDLEIHDVELPDGNTSRRELVYHNGAVAICAITPNDEVLLVKQFRKPVEKALLEIPAGKLEQYEVREEAAKRELEEETGYVANNLKFITDMYGCPGFTNEKLTIYFSNNLSEGQLNLDEDEFVELHKVPISDIKALLDNHEIEDAKTIIGLQYILLNYNHSN